MAARKFFLTDDYIIISSDDESDESNSSQILQKNVENVENLLSPIPENSKNTTESTSNELSPPGVELKYSTPTFYEDTVTDPVKTGLQKNVENVKNLLNSSESPEKLLKMLKSKSANSSSQMDTQKLLETQNLIDPETINRNQNSQNGNNFQAQNIQIQNIQFNYCCRHVQNLVAVTKFDI